MGLLGVACGTGIAISIAGLGFSYANWTFSFVVGGKQCWWFGTCSKRLRVCHVILIDKGDTPALLNAISFYV